MAKGHVAIRKSGESRIQFFELTQSTSHSSLKFYWRAFNKNESPLVFDLIEVKEKSFPLSFSADVPEDQSYEAYLKMIASTVSEIQAKNWDKVVMSRTKKVDFSSARAFELLDRLSEKYPDATVYLFSHPQIGSWMGATPEKLITRKGNDVTSMSLAGTQQKPEDFTSKEIEEQKPVTRFILEKFAENKALHEVLAAPVERVKAGPVNHLRSMVSAKANNGFKTSEMAENLHPTPAVGGSPRNEALTYISENEAYSRSFYAGYFGISQKNTDNFYVNLRCMQLFKDHCVLYAGGGITANSNPEAEWLETEHKMQTLQDFLKNYA